MCEVNADGNFDFYTKFYAVQLKYLFAQSVYLLHTVLRSYEIAQCGREVLEVAH